MNIGEANAFNRLMRSVALESLVGDDDAIDAAVFLTDRARATLNAGPTGQELRDLYAELD